MGLLDADRGEGAVVDFRSMSRRRDVGAHRDLARDLTPPGRVGDDSELQPRWRLPRGRHVAADVFPILGDGMALQVGVWFERSPLSERGFKGRRAHLVVAGGRARLRVMNALKNDVCETHTVGDDPQHHIRQYADQREPIDRLQVHALVRAIEGPAVGGLSVRSRAESSRRICRSDDDAETGPWRESPPMAGAAGADQWTVS